MKKTVGGVVLSIFLVIFLFIIGRMAEYLLAEYVYQTHGFSKEDCRTCRDSNSKLYIPKHIHQIFFFETDPVLPTRLAEAQSTWIKMNPGFNYTLWNKTSINELIDREYKWIREIYDSYDHWVKRADVARYLVVHHYGGWYVDMDVTCLKSIDNLTNVANQQNKSLVLRWTLPDGCSNDFIGVTRNHPFIGHVINGLPAANRWYPFPYMSTMFSTGPMFMWGRFLNYPYKEELLKITNHSQYLGLMHRSSWHSWDGIIVWHFYNHVTEFWTLLFLVSFLSCALCALYKYRTKKSNSRPSSPRGKMIVS